MSFSCSVNNRLGWGQGLVPALLRWQGCPLVKRLKRAAQHPALAQQGLLKEFLVRHQGTVFGRTHGFRQIQTAADYRQAVPIRDYEALRPYVQRMMQGEANILVRDPVQMFTLTSGTTGQPKYIPVTAYSEACNSNLMRQWLYCVLIHHPRCFDRALVGIVSPAVEGYTPSGIPYGSLSGRIYQELPWLIRRVYAIPYPVFEIKDYDARYWAMTRFALMRQVSFLGTPNPSTLLRLAAVMTTHSEALIRAIYDGTLGLRPRALEPDLYEHLQNYLRPQPKRAKALEQIATTQGCLIPKDCWPHLQLVGCWTGGSVGIQAQRLAAVYGPVPLRDVGYLASEARVTLPIANGTPNGVLDLALNYCEFIPEASVDEENPPIYLSHELEKGQRYSILLTTPGGLYRYHINDIVEVTGFYYQAPMLAFVRKGKDMSNLTGEKLHVNQIMMAMTQVKKQFDLAFGPYQWVANVQEMRYHLYIEWQAPCNDDWIRHTLLPQLDQTLGQLNVEYGQKRASRRLQSLCCHRMQPGWADALQRDAISRGGRDVQYKWRVLCPEPELNELTKAYQQAVLQQSEPDTTVRTT